MASTAVQRMVELFFTVLLFSVLMNNLSRKLGENYQQIPNPIPENLAVEPSQTKHRDKVMHFRTHKTGGSTLSSIIFKIAAKQHKYTITDSTKNTWRNTSQYGYFIQQTKFDNVHNFLTSFPKSEFIWVKTVREPEQQMYSRISFKRLNAQFEEDQLYETLRQGTSQALTETQVGYVLQPCLRDKNLNKSCAEELMDLYDLIIPLERFNEGLLLLSDMMGLPIEEFSYFKGLKKSKNRLQLNKTIVNKIMADYKPHDNWFYNRALDMFQNKINNWKKTLSRKTTVATRLGTLSAKSNELAQECVETTGEHDQMEYFTLNTNNMENNIETAVSCLAFAINPERNPIKGEVVDAFNKAVEEQLSGAANVSKPFYPFKHLVEKCRNLKFI